MAAGSVSRKVALALSSFWLLTLSLSLLAAVALLVFSQNWHAVRGPLQQLSLWQSWISIAACAVLLAISRKKHDESQQPWAQGALLIYVLGGLLTALLWHHGVLPQWLAHATSLWKSVQLMGLLLLHWGCAAASVRHIWRAT